MMRILRGLGWVALAALGAVAYATLAFHRGEPLNSAYILVAALCTFSIGYRFYSRWIALRVLGLDARREHERVNPWILWFSVHNPIGNWLAQT